MIFLQFRHNEKFVESFNVREYKCFKYDNKYLHEGNETFVLMDKQVLFIEIFTSLHENA